MSVKGALISCFPVGKMELLSFTEEYALLVVESISPDDFVKLYEFANKNLFGVNVEPNLEFGHKGLEIELSKLKSMSQTVTIDAKLISNVPNDMELGKLVRELAMKQVKEDGKQKKTK